MKLHYYILIMFLFFSFVSFGQITAIKADATADEIETTLGTEARIHGHTEIIVSTAKDVVSTAGNVMNRVYGIYKNIVAATETVSDYISTAQEIKNAVSDVYDIIDMYSKYGVSIKFGSFYDMDAYLNPRQQADYMNRMLDILEQSATCLEWIQLIALGKSGGAYSSEQIKNSSGSNILGNNFVLKDKDGNALIDKKGKNLKMNDYWRLRMLRQFAAEIRVLKNQMFDLIMRTTRLITVNYNNERYFVEFDGVFDYSKYHYSNVGLLGLGHYGREESGSSVSESNVRRQDYYEKLLDWGAQQDLSNRSIFSLPRSEFQSFMTR